MKTNNIDVTAVFRDQEKTELLGLLQKLHTLHSVLGTQFNK